MDIRCEGGPLHNSVRDVPEEALKDGFATFLVEEAGKPSGSFVYRVEVRPVLVYVGHADKTSGLLLP